MKPNYQRKNFSSLDEEIIRTERLVNNIEDALEKLKLQLQKKKAEKRRIDSLDSVSIKIEDLKRVLSSITGEDVNIYIQPTSYSNDNDNSLEGIIGIEFKNGSNTNQLRYDNLSLFDNISLREEDSDEIICNFKIDEVINNKGVVVNGFGDKNLLEKGIFECIKKGKIKDYELKNNHNNTARI